MKFTDVNPFSKNEQSKINKSLLSTVKKGDFILGKNVEKFEKKFSKLDVESKYKPAVGINILIDNLFSNQRLKASSQSNLPYYLEIRGLKKFSDHKSFENILKNILFINNLSLMSLRNNSATYSFNLLSEERNLLNYFDEIENLILINKEKDKLFLALGE